MKPVSDGGKKDSLRKRQVSRETYDNNWDLAFGKDKPRINHNDTPALERCDKTIEMDLGQDCE